MNYRQKIDWCLTKAIKGLKTVEPDIAKAKKHITIAESNLLAVEYFKQGGFTAWCAPALFYAVYHCFLAVLLKEGYYSENQDCTFSVIALFIHEGKFPLTMKKLKMVMGYEGEDELRGLRERFQYGTEKTISPALLEETQKLAQEIVMITKQESEKW